jgi:hypothetical protein
MRAHVPFFVGAIVVVVRRKRPSAPRATPVAWTARENRPIDFQ